MKVIKKTLPNGFRVLVVPMKDTLTATILLLVEAGSKYEAPEENGISHFLEHMCFKGTVKRPRSIDITGELDGIGAQNNAFTSHEFTGYYAKGHAKHFKKMSDVISDLYLNPTFPSQEIEKEKGVIIEEMNMYQDLPQRIVHDEFMALLYGDQPAGKTILGDKAVVKNATQDTFLLYRGKHYQPQSTILVVSGNVNAKEVFHFAKHAFGSLKKGKKFGMKKTKEVQKKPELRIRPKQTDQAHIIMGVRAFDVFDKKNPALDVLNAVLGGGMSARLFQTIREELGVAYYVRSSVDTFIDHGFLAVSMGVDKTRIVESMSAVMNLLKDLKTTLVSEAELKKAKESILGNLVMGLESSDSVSEYVGIQEIMKKKIESPKEFEKKIRAVTAQEVKQVANMIFKNSNLNCAIVGNVLHEDEVKDVLSF